MQAAIGFIAMEREGGSELFEGVPIWTVQLIIAIGFGIMMLRFFILSLENLFNLIPNQKEPAQ